MTTDKENKIKELESILITLRADINSLESEFKSIQLKIFKIHSEEYEKEIFKGRTKEEVISEIKKQYE